MRQIQFAVFFTVFLGIFFLLNYYIFARVLEGLFLSPLQVRILIVLMCFFSSVFLVSNFLKGKYFNYGLSSAGGVWFVVLCTAATLLFAAHLLIIIFPAQAKPITLSVLCLIAVIASLSFFIGQMEHVIREYQIPVKGLAPANTGFTIVQLSDLHLDNIKTENWLSGIVDRTNNLNPDIVVITGDIIERPLLKDYAAELKRLSARYGVYAVTGNHDYYSGLEHLEKMLSDSGINFLKGGFKDIEGVIRLAGLEDPTAGQYGLKPASLSDILTSAGEKLPLIILNHQPDRYIEAEKLGAALQLSGHIHNGQFLPFNFIVRAVKRYPYGLYRRGNMYLYTSAGTGTWIAPMRFLSRSEIVKFTLVPA